MLSIVLAALVGTLLSLQLACEVSNGAFGKDYFRHFFYTVIPLVDGSGSPALLFKNHHASPLMHFHQILTSLVLDVSLRADAYIGITLFFCMAVGLAAMAFGEISARSGSLMYGLTVALLVSILMTGLTATGPIAWPLIYLQAYFLCLGMLVAVATYLLCEQPANTTRFFLYLGAVILAVLLHTSYGMLFFVASVPAVAIRVLSRRDYRLLLLLVIASALVAAWNNLALPAMGQMELRGDGYSADRIAARIMQLPLIAAAFGKALLTGVHGDAITYAVNKREPASWQLAIFASVALAYAVTAVWALLQSRKVLVAGVIMFAVSLGSASALLSRGGETFTFNIDAPRYVLLYRFAVAAFAWALTDALLSLCRASAPQLADAMRNRLLCGAASVMLLGAVVVQAAAFVNIQDSKGELSIAAGWGELATYMHGVDARNTFTLQGWQAGGNPPWVNRRVIDWLAGRRANVFSPGYRASPYLANYKRGRSAFVDERRQPLPLRVDAGNCIVHPHSGANRPGMPNWIQRLRGAS
jgi:hypothetical protein